jgi:hypothetical protein
LRKALRLIDPKLRKCRRQNEQSDYEILRWFRLLATKDKKSKAASKRGEDEKLRIQRVLEIAHEIVSRPSPPRFPGSEAASD